MIRQILFLLIICIVISCNTNTTEKAGINVEKTIISTNNKPVIKKEFTYGEMINLSFNNVTGLTKFEDKVYPKATIYLLNEKKDTIEITNYEFGEKLMTDKPLDLNIDLLAVLTDATNKKCELKIKIEDDRGEAAYNYSMPFSIVPNKNFFVKADGISYMNIYLYDESKRSVITDNVANSKEGFSIIYEGLEGFKLDNINFIYPAASVKIVDASGAVLLEEKNLLKDYEELGYKNADAYSSLPLKIKLDKASAENPVKLTVELYDLKSSNKLKLETKLTLQ